MKNEKRKGVTIDWIRLGPPRCIRGPDLFLSVTTMAAIENGARYIIRNVQGKTVLDLDGADYRSSKSPYTPLAPCNHFIVLSI